MKIRHVDFGPGWWKRCMRWCYASLVLNIFLILMEIFFLAVRICISVIQCEGSNNAQTSMQVSVRIIMDSYHWLHRWRFCMRQQRLVKDLKRFVRRRDFDASVLLGWLEGLNARFWR